MDVEYRIDKDSFVIACIEDETNEGVKLTDELNRLESIGYLYSQTALDIAMDARKRLIKIRKLTDCLNDQYKNELNIDKLEASIQGLNTTIAIIEYKLKES